MSIRRPLLLALAGSFGLSGAALARPADRDNDRPDRAVSRERVGTPPVGAIRSEISLRVQRESDGRGDTRATDAAVKLHLPSMNHAQNDGRPSHAMPLPLKSDITNRIELRDGDSDDPKLARHETVQRSYHKKDYRATQPAPVPLKSDIAIKVGMASSDSDEASPKTLAAQPTELRGDAAKPQVATDRKSHSAIDQRSRVTVDGKGIAVLMNAATKMHMRGGSDGEKDEK